MASNWIKIEHVTPDKPEVVAIADLLGIDQDSAFGKCVRLWIWADQQTVSGNALSVTEKFLDRITSCDGFSNAMKSVGWLTVENGKLFFPNFSRHNGQSSKSRALTSKRVDDFRGKICNAVIVTNSLPEKRREEKNKEITPLPPTGGDEFFKNQFDAARKTFPGTKGGLKTEWENFRKKHKDHREAIPLLAPAIEKEIRHKSELVARGQFAPAWANFSTWVNQRRWEWELGATGATGGVNGKVGTNRTETRRERLDRDAREFAEELGLSPPGNP